MCKLKEIYAYYDNKTIRVYQAFNSRISEEALNLGTFGPSFKLDRMTWIKPSFLWMMYRSGWGTKKDQERVLAIDILRDGFDEVLSKVVLSNFSSDIYLSYDEWKQKLITSDVRCQWDPDRDIYGKPIRRRAIQLGLKGKIVKKYINNWIYKITDITEYVHKYSISIEKGGFHKSLFPLEKIYPVTESTKSILGM